MIRKTINIILSGLLIITTTGFSISKHYCHGNLISVAINKDAESCCGMDMEMPDHCQNEEEHIQLDEDFIYKEKQDNYVMFLPLFSDLITLFPQFTQTPEIETGLRIHSSDIPHPPEIHTFLSLIQAYLL